MSASLSIRRSPLLKDGRPATAPNSDLAVEKLLDAEVSVNDIAAQDRTREQLTTIMVDRCRLIRWRLT